MKLLYLTMAMLESSQAMAPFDPISITENGNPRTLYIVGVGKPSHVISGVLNSGHNSHTYLGIDDGAGGKKWNPEVRPDIYYTPNLLGGSIEFDIDLHESTCGCNASVYFTQMPARSPDGTPDKTTDGDYYCGAGDSKAYCPEIDILEANQYAW